MSRTLHVISHTHWDREWYLPYQWFRKRLVRMIDNLLDLLAQDPDYRAFHLDGQTIVLEDYLQIRPQRAAELRQRISEGRLLVGPWYQLNDEFLVSGEATVRSLLVGHRQAASMGHVMKIGHVPDQFGHVAQLPQIMQGFGIDNVIFGRGYQLQPGDKAEFWWEAPDGTRVLAILMPHWYNNAQRFPAAPDEAVAYTERIVERLAPLCNSNHLLLMNGVDHLEAQDDLSAILRSLAGQLGEDVIVHSTMAAFVAGVKQDLANQPLAVVRRELRDDNHSACLAGTLSTRMYLKMANHDCQTTLERVAEPLNSMALMLGGPYDYDFFHYAWKLLMWNHPHDSICGCSVDAVHDEMMTRFAQVDQVATELTTDALRWLGVRIDTSQLEGQNVALAVWNTLPWERSEVVAVTVDFPLGPPTRSGRAAAVDMLETPDIRGITILDESGKRVPFSVKKTEIIMKQILSPVELPHVQNVRRFEVRFHAAHLPPGGYEVYRVCPSHPAQTKTPASHSRCSLVAGERELENEYLNVWIELNGTVTVVDRRSGQRYSGLNLFEDVGDVGDEYRHVAPPDDRRITTASSSPQITLEHDGPEMATFRLDYVLALPEEAIEQGRLRSHHSVACRLSTWISLSRGSRRIEFVTEFENNCRDHRLRVLFPSDIETDHSCADGQFVVNERALELPAHWREASPFHPQQAFVSLSGRAMASMPDTQASKAVRGLTVINRGLPEYEVYRDRRHTVAITLLRSVGRLSGGGDAPGAQLTPGAQCKGTYRFHYAVCPHGGNWLAAHAHREAYAFNVPIPVHQLPPQVGQLPWRSSFLALTPAELTLSALKRAEDDSGLILRFYNLIGEAVQGCISLAVTPREVWRTNLNEEPQEKLNVRVSADAANRSWIEVEVRPQEIITLKLVF